MNQIFNLLCVFIILFLFTPACRSKGGVANTSHDTSGMSSVPYSKIYFDVNKFEVKNPSIIERNARWIKANKDRVVILEGHCDERGSGEYNLHLGDLRARAVMQALMKQGVSENQLIIVSYGKDRPIIKKRSQEGWAKNRRVEFVLR